MATIANGGTRYVPHLLKGVDEGRGWTSVTPPAPAAIVPMRPDHVSALPRRAVLVVTARAPADAARSRCATSGQDGHRASHLDRGPASAPPDATDKDLRDHGWFVFCAPRIAPEIAGVVFAALGARLPGGPHREARDGNLLRQEGGRPLPPVPVPPPVVVAEAAAAAPRLPGSPTSSHVRAPPDLARRLGPGRSRAGIAGFGLGDESTHDLRRHQGNRRAAVWTSSTRSGSVVRPADLPRPSTTAASPSARS